MRSVSSRSSEGSPECELFRKSGKPTHQLVDGLRGSLFQACLVGAPQWILGVLLATRPLSRKGRWWAAQNMPSSGQSGVFMFSFWPSFHPLRELDAFCAGHHVT